MEENYNLDKPGGFSNEMPLNVNEVSAYMGFEQCVVFRREFNKFMLYLNRSGYSDSWQDAVHNLYISLFHLENMEKAMYSSDISEEVLHREKIVEKLQFLKMAILGTIEEIKSGIIL